MVRGLKWFALASVLLIGLAAAVKLPGLRQSASVGAGYVAQQMCSCVYVSGRSLDSCLPDLLPGMEAINAEPIEADSGDHGIRAWVPLLAERVALHEEGYGCTLQ